jgi:rhamnosyltransferase
MKKHSVSVIIPTWNGGKWLEQLLTMLEEQTLVPDEILLVDSGSTDATRSIAHRYQVQFLSIEQQDFDHGGTRSLAAAHTSGDILVYMTQDAIPAGKDALQRLVEPLLDQDDSDNKKIAATYGRQLPAPDATLFSEHLRLYNYPAQPEGVEVRCWQDRTRLGFKTIFISNSFAAWQREYLAETDFFPERLLFGEDTLTVAKLLESGYCVAYVSDACVYHSHNYSILQDLRRYFDIGVFHVSQRRQLMKFGGLGGAGRKYVRSELAMLLTRKKFFLLPEWFLRNSGKFIAYNLGKRYRNIPHGLAQRLSMTRSWWN